MPRGASLFGGWWEKNAVRVARQTGCCIKQVAASCPREGTKKFTRPKNAQLRTPLNPSVTYSSNAWGVSWGPYLVPHDAEIRQSLGQLHAWSLQFFQSGRGKEGPLLSRCTRPENIFHFCSNRNQWGYNFLFDLISKIFAWVCPTWRCAGPSSKSDHFVKFLRMFWKVREFFF